MLGSKILNWHVKFSIYIYINFCHHKTILLKNTFKIAWQYLFNVVILPSRGFKFILALKLKKDPKTSILKPVRKFVKKIRQP